MREKLLSMKAAIIAGGVGSRIKADYDVPKPLIPFHGMPIIERTVRILESAGINEMVLVVKHNRQIVEHFKRVHVNSSLDFVTSDDKNVVDALFVLENSMGRDKENFLLLFGDIVFGPTIFRRFVKDMEETRYEMVLAVSKTRTCDYEVRMNRRNEIVQIVEKDGNVYKVWVYSFCPPDYFQLHPMKKGRNL